MKRDFFEKRKEKEISERMDISEKLFLVGGMKGRVTRRSAREWDPK